MSNRNTKLNLTNSTLREFLIFQVGEIRCGIDILEMDGINWVPSITPVYGAPNYVKGLLNLRGQVVTVLDLGKRLGIGACQGSKKSRIIIVTIEEEHIGLLVDYVTEVIYARESEILPPPENTMKSQGVFFKGILKNKNRLITLLNVAAILNTDI